MEKNTALDIAGVQLIKPTQHADSRGVFFEAFRASWFAPDNRRWVQWNVSRSAAGVLRGMHYHRKQTDYWYLVQGRILAGLTDLRTDSPTHGRGMCVELSGDDPSMLFIPVGVCHGFRALTDITLMYLLDQEYDGADEYGVRWNDPKLKLPKHWYEMPPPVLSPRDDKAAFLK